MEACPTENQNRRGNGRMGCEHATVQHKAVFTHRLIGSTLTAWCCQHINITSNNDDTVASTHQQPSSSGFTRSDDEEKGSFCTSSALI
jgi:hypothetical protein